LFCVRRPWRGLRAGVCEYLGAGDPSTINKMTGVTALDGANSISVSVDQIGTVQLRRIAGARTKAQVSMWLFGAPTPSLGRRLHSILMTCDNTKDLLVITLRGCQHPPLTACELLAPRSRRFPPAHVHRGDRAATHAVLDWLSRQDTRRRNSSSTRSAGRLPGPTVPLITALSAAPGYRIQSVVVFGRPDIGLSSKSYTSSKPGGRHDADAGKCRGCKPAQ
jgi:hypothetical protein